MGPDMYGNRLKEKQDSKQLPQPLPKMSHIAELEEEKEDLSSERSDDVTTSQIEGEA